MDLYDATAPEPKRFKGGMAASADYDNVSPYYPGPSSDPRMSYAPESVNPSQSGYGNHTMSHGGSSYAAGSSVGDPMSPVFHPAAPTSASSGRGGRVSKSAAAAREPLEPQYRIQADAGRIPQPGAAPVAAPVIDMPPTYNPDWQEEDDGPSTSAGGPSATHPSDVGQPLLAAPREDQDFRLSSRTAPS